RRPAFSWRDPPPQPSQTTNAPISRSAHVDSPTDACRAESWASARTLRRPYWNRRHDFVCRQDANPSRRSHTVWKRRVDVFGTTGHVRTWWWCGPRKRWWRVRAGDLLSIEPNDVRAHNLRVVQLRHGAEGMSSALMFRRIMRSAASPMSASMWAITSGG